MIRAAQLPYLRRLAESVTPIRLVTEVDRARDRAFQLRRQIRETISQSAWGTELMAIEPLLDEYDPALVAAAALHQRGVAEQPESETPSWTRVYVTVGRRDGTRPADLVGILVKVAGFRPNAIGRIDIRDSFSLIEVRPEDAEQAIRGLNGQTVRGRRVLARLDKK